MIKNDRQYRSVRAHVGRLERLLDELAKQHADADSTSARARLETAAVRGQVVELGEQLEEYDALREGRRPVGAPESLDQLPVLLIRARIAARLSQADLASRLGLKEQQIQRYEATGYEGANLRRLREVADALKLRLGPAAPPGGAPNVDQLLRQLEGAGLPKELVRRRFAPFAVAGGDGAEAGVLPVITIAARVGRALGLDATAVLRGEQIDASQAATAAAAFKLPKGVNEPRLVVYAAYARYLALLVLRATAALPARPVPGHPGAFREAVLTAYGTVDFASVLRYVWDLGVPVLPLADPGGFHAAYWRTGGRGVIVLKQSARLPARWLFDLVHEIGHATEAPEQPERALVEVDVAGGWAQQDPLETRASNFARYALLGGRAREVGDRCVTEAGGDLRRLKGVVPRIAAEEGVDPGALANDLAYRLALQGENWWGAAHNLQPSQPDPWKVARDVLLSYVDFGVLEPIDRDLLVQALNEDDPMEEPTQ